MSLPSIEDTIEFLRELAEDEDKLPKSFYQTVRGALYSFAGAVVGGATLGPLAIPVGAAVAGGLAVATGESFTPLAQIIYEMSSEKQQKLVQIVWNIMTKHGVTTLAAIGTATAIRSELVEMLKNS